jgi:hypothetical protein
MSRLSREVAEASRVLENELPSARFVKPSTGNALVDSAKRVQRLSTKAAKLRRELKTVEADIRTEKRHLKALCQEVAGKGEPTP